MGRIEVAVAAPLVNTLSYSFDPEVEGNPVGRRVLVRMGAQKLTGYVLGLLPEDTVSYRILPVLHFLDDEPLFPENLVEFFKWIAKYYHYPIGEVIKTALPSGTALRSRKIVKLTPSGKTNLLSWPTDIPEEPNWFTVLLQNGSLTPVVSKTVLHSSNFRKVIAEMQEKEWIQVDDILDKQKTFEKRELCYSITKNIPLPELSDENNRAILNESAKQIVDGKPLSVPIVRTLMCLSKLSKEQGGQQIAAKDVRKMYSGASKALKELKERNLVTEEKRRVYRNPFGETLVHYTSPKTLSEEQNQVLGQILPALNKQIYKPFMLHGVTGCGKTEVYLQATAETLKQGRDVLILVPEIALATQLEAHFVSRFGDKVLLLHSGLSTGERFDQWALAANGKGKIVIGARSAVFAPLADPGLIVVDEEHDNAYKQADGFRYHGRDLAVLRGRYNNAVVILGSGTPGITSFYNAKSGRFQLLTMAKRIENRSLPHVTLVDLRDEKQKVKGKAIGRRLHHELESNLAQQKQSILLLNRRGFSSIYLCKDCGEPVKCLHCHVSLTYHKQRAHLVCHYCGYSLHENIVCGSCRSANLTPVGFDH